MMFHGLTKNTALVFAKKNLTEVSVDEIFLQTISFLFAKYLKTVPDLLLSRSIIQVKQQYSYKLCKLEKVPENRNPKFASILTNLKFVPF